jgi:hypothetical protein
LLNFWKKNDEIAGMGIGLSSLEQQMGSGNPSQASWLKRRSTWSLWVGHSQSLKTLPKSFTPNMVLRLGFCCCKNWNFCFSSQSPIKTFIFIKQTSSVVLLRVRKTSSTILLDKNGYHFLWKSGLHIIKSLDEKKARFPSWVSITKIHANDNKFDTQSSCD